jgi:hypothetical protein
MRSVLRFAAALVLFTAVTAPVCYAEDFSADMTTSSQQGSFQGRILVSGEKSRIEMPGAVTISRMDKKEVWMLIPEQKMYVEQPFDPKSGMGMRDKIYGEVERKDEGSEMIDGRMAKKYLVTVVSNGRSESIYQWIDESVSIPVKTAAVDGSWSSELKNIRVGRQDATLFEIPEGYKKMPVGIPDMNDVSQAMSQAAQDEGYGE